MSRIGPVRQNDPHCPPNPYRQLRARGEPGECGLLELNGQYLYREDDAPTFTKGELVAETEGGFLEALLRLPGGRWYATALYNRVESSRSLLDVRLGGEGNLTRYESVTLGGGFLMQRNLRVMAEITRNVETLATSLTAGVVTAF